MAPERGDMCSSTSGTPLPSLLRKCICPKRVGIDNRAREYHGSLEGVASRMIDQACAARNRLRPTAPPNPAFRCAACGPRPRRGRSRCEEISREMPPRCRRRPASPEDPTPRPPTSAAARAARASTLRYLRACTESGSPSDGADRPRAAPGRRPRVYPRPPATNAACAAREPRIAEANDAGQFLE